MRWLWWILCGKPMLSYSGFHCGICGKWFDEPFSIPDYQSSGEWVDSWGLCLNH